MLPALILLGMAEATIRLFRLHLHCSGYEWSTIWSCDPILSFQLKDGVMPAGKPLNKKGFRGREFTPKRPGVYRVLALGDSTTFGVLLERSFEYVEEPYPERLEHLVDQRVGPGKVEVLNGGVPGYNSFMGVMLLRGKLRGLRPDLILVRFGWNDHLMSKGGGESQLYREIDNPLLLKAEDLLLTTATYPFLRRIGRELASWREPEHQPTLADIPQEWKPDVPLEQYRHNLRRIVALGRQGGSEVWLSTTPHAFLVAANRGRYDKFRRAAQTLLALNAIPSFDRLIEIHDDYAEATRAVGRELGIPVVDMEAEYAAHAEEPLYSSADVIHPTQEGHDLEAEVLYARMVAVGILPRRH